MRKRSDRRRRRRGSLRIQLTLLSAVMATIPLAAGALAIAQSFRAQLLSQVVDDAREACVLITSRLDFQTEPPTEWTLNGGSKCLSYTFPTEEEPTPLQHLNLPRVTTKYLGSRPTDVILDPADAGLSLWPLTDSSAASVTISRSVSIVRGEGTTPPRRGQIEEELAQENAEQERIVGIAVPFSPEEYAIWTRSLEREQDTLNTMVLALTGGALLLTALVGAAAWSTVGLIIRPVEAIRRKVADITTHNLSDRVPVPRSQTEIVRLAETVNGALTRLENAVTEQQRFAADASHELRGPITALRGELEIALAHPDQAHWPRVVADALDDTKRLQQLATDLLLLTQLDATALKLDHVVDLTLIAREQGTLRRIPDHLSLRYDLSPAEVNVRGRPALLGRLVRNLLDNARRHATGTVTLVVAVEESTAVLEVIDDGPGIPHTDRERVFERFTRLDQARARDTGGTGLGLAIARHIATVHHGTLHVTDSHGGARLTARIPLAGTT